MLLYPSAMLQNRTAAETRAVCDLQSSSSGWRANAEQIKDLLEAISLPQKTSQKSVMHPAAHSEEQTLPAGSADGRQSSSH